MTGIGEVASVLGVISFAGDAIKSLSQTYKLVKRYQNAQPRVTRLLEEIKTTSNLLSTVERQYADPKTLGVLTSASKHSIDNWLERCRATLWDIESYFATSTPTSLKKRTKAKIAVNNDEIDSFDRRLRDDRELLLSLLQPISWDVNLRTHLGVDRLQHHATSTASSISLLQTQSNSLADRTSAGFDSTNAQLAQVMSQLSILSQQLCKSNPLSASVSNKSSTKSSQIPPKKTERYRSRVVQLAKQQYFSRGALQTKFIVMDSPEFDDLSEAAKVGYIRYLILLRLYVWLLQHDAFYTRLSFAFSATKTSFLIRGARLNFDNQLSSHYILLRYLKYLDKLYENRKGPMVHDASTNVTSYWLRETFDVDYVRARRRIIWNDLSCLSAFLAAKNGLWYGSYRTSIRVHPSGFHIQLLCPKSLTGFEFRCRSVRSTEVPSLVVKGWVNGHGPKNFINGRPPFRVAGYT